MTMQSLATIFVSFLKIGMFTFGGGYAMLPLIERELITKRKWIEQKEFLDEMIAPNLYSMFVTPKDVDETIKYLSFTISEGLNIAFSQV